MTGYRLQKQIAGLSIEKQIPFIIQIHKFVFRSTTYTYMTESTLYCRAQMQHQIIQVMEAIGYDRQILYKEMDFDLDKVSPDELLPFDSARGFWPAIIKYIPEDEASFILMEYFSMSAFGVAGYVIVNSPTCVKAYENFIRYNALTSNLLSFELRTNDTFELSIKLMKDYEPNDRFEIEMNVIGFINFTKSLTASHRLPIAVYLQYPKPLNTVPYETLLPGVPIHFSSEKTTLVYPHEVSQIKLVGANPLLYQTFDNMAEEALKAHQSEGSIAHQVRSELTHSLKSGMPTVDEVARKMNLSERTLQLKLKAENTSFREISDEVRRDIAIHHLKKGMLNISEIAYLLGFSEVSSFSSAFKKWTGAAPSLYVVTA